LANLGFFKQTDITIDCIKISNLGQGPGPNYLDPTTRFSYGPAQPEFFLQLRQKFIFSAYFHPSAYSIASTFYCGDHSESALRWASI
jgi:hypothetical protein